MLIKSGFRDIDCRVVGDLPISDLVLQRTFFVGVYPGLDGERIDYILNIFGDFVSQIGMSSSKHV